MCRHSHMHTNDPKFPGSIAALMMWLIIKYKQEGLARLSSIETMPEFKNNGNYCNFSFVHIAALKNSSYETATKKQHCTDLYL